MTSASALTPDDAQRRLTALLSRLPRGESTGMLAEARRLLADLADAVPAWQAAFDEQAEALRQQQESFRAVVDSAREAIIMMGPDGEVALWGPGAESMFGWTTEEATGRPVHRLLAPERAIEASGRGIQAFRETGRSPAVGRTLEMVAVHKDGHEFPVELSLSSLGLGDGWRALGIVRDITERKRADAALQSRTKQLEAVRTIGAEIAREMDLRKLLDLISRRAAELVGGPSGTVRLWDEPSETLVPVAWHGLGEWFHGRRLHLGEGFSGVVAQNRTGMAVDDYPTSPYAAPSVLEQANITAVLGEPLLFRERLLGVITVAHQDPGHIFSAQDQDILRLFADQAAIAIENARLFEAARRELDDRKRAEHDLQVSRDLLERALGGVDEAVFVVDARRTIVQWTDSAEALFGYPRAEAVGRTTEFLYTTTREWMHMGEEAALTLTEGLRRTEAVMRRRDGKSFPAAVYAGLLSRSEERDTLDSFVAVVRDISAQRQAEAEQRRLEEQFRQSQKVEMVGRLAGGIAHDLNNLLTPILGYVELVLARLGPEDEMRADLHEVEKAARRARDLTHQLLAFSRKQPMDLRPVNLSEMVGQFEKILRRTVREDIYLTTRLAPSLPAVRADRAQLQQVLLNLVVNANDAMPAGGRLTITTDQAICSAADVEGWAEASPGPYVRLIVRDTGCGMDGETRRHLFEPFFTTKPEGKGTGLGLATCYGIVRQHGGFFRVESAHGQGSTFSVYLPRVDQGAPAAETPSPGGAVAGCETVLFVDDARTVRKLIDNILRPLGYDTIEAVTPEAALRAAKRHPGPIHLLISDVIMPGMNGRQLYEAMRKARPELRVLYISGYTDEIIAPHGVLEPGTHFLAKPFTVAALTEKIREVLGAGA